MTIEELKSLFPKSSIQEKDGFFNVSININKLLACDFMGFNTLNKDVYAEFSLYVNSFKQPYNPSLPLHKHYYSLNAETLSFHTYTSKKHLLDEVSKTTNKLLDTYIANIKADNINLSCDKKKVEQFINKTYEDISTILSKNRNFVFFKIQ